MMLKEVPYFKQRRDYTCGPASLKMVLDYLGVEAHREILRRMASSREDVGTNYKGMIQAVVFHYRRCFVRKNATMADIRYFLEMHLPVIINWYIDKEKVGHFSVVVGLGKKYITVNDPAHGPRRRIRIDLFQRVWHDSKKRNRNWMMVVLPRRIKIQTPPGRGRHPPRRQIYLLPRRYNGLVPMECGGKGRMNKGTNGAQGSRIREVPTSCNWFFRDDPLDER